VAELAEKDLGMTQRLLIAYAKVEKLPIEQKPSVGLRSVG